MSSVGKVLRMHHVENEYAFQVLSGFDDNFLVFSNDYFESVIYQKLNEGSLKNFPNVCGDTNVKIYDAVALQVNDVNKSDMQSTIRPKSGGRWHR